MIAHIDEANLAFASEMMRAKVAQIHECDPPQIAHYLGSLEAKVVDGVVLMAPELPQVRYAKARLAQRGIEAVSFISGQTSADSEDFVGIDNHAAGAMAGRLMGRFSQHQPGKILVIWETMHAHDSLKRRLGFGAVINADFMHLTVMPSLETYRDSDRTAHILRASCASHRDIAGIYVLSSEARVPLAAATKIVSPSTSPTKARLSPKPRCRRNGLPR